MNPPITKGQLEVAIAERLSMGQIGERFGKSTNTISRHMRRHGLRTNVVPLSERPDYAEKMRQITKKTWEDTKYRDTISKATKSWCEDPGNVQIMSRRTKSLWETSEYRDKLTSKMNTSETKMKVSEAAKTVWADAEYKNKRNIQMNSIEYKAKISKTSTILWGSPEYREKMSRAGKDAWKDPEYRSKMSAIWTDPKYIESRLIGSKALWENPEYRSKMSKVWDRYGFREKMAAYGRAQWEDPEYRERMTAYGRAQWEDPGFREKMAAYGRAQWEDPEYRERMKGIFANPVYREKMSAKTKAQWEDPEFREKMAKIYATPEYREKMAKARENMPWSMTKPHQNVCDILAGLDTKFEIEKAIGFYNFDLYLPDHKILIEVQGEYWHGLPDHVRRDKAKATYIERYQPDLKLHYVWEYECGQPNKIIEKLKYWCGLTKLELVDYEFKDLTVGPVDKEKANELLTTWHYLDSGRSGIDYGVYLNGELIAMARWTSIGRQGIASHVGYEASEVLELARLCVHPRYQKKNLLTWFLSRVEKDIRKNRPDIKCLVSFSDMSQGHTGAVYKAANWEQVSTVSPSYYYIDKEGYVMNKKKLYNYAVRMKTKEAEYAESHGFVKVPTLEKHKFIKRLDTK